MPNFKGHVAGAAAAYIAVITLFSLWPLSYSKLIPYFFATIAGALFPDIDTKSKGQQMFYSIMFVILLVCFLYKAYFSAALLALCSITPMVTTHRGLYHNFWFLCVLTASCAFFFGVMFPAYKSFIITNASFFMIGVTSHLWLDLGAKKMLKL